MVHSDVVSANENEWIMTVKNNVAKGRGTSDMKFSIPIGIALLNEIIETKSKSSFSFVITTDEEVGGFEGAKFLADKLKFRPKALVVPDGGDNMEFVNKAKGISWIKLTSTGKSAHSSRIFNGKNALAPLTVIASKLLEKYQANNTKEGWNTTMNIGKIEGGKSVNQVCPNAEMILDFRFDETRSVKEVFAEVNSLTKKVSQQFTTKIEIELLSSGDPVFTDTNLPVVKKFIESMEKKLTKDKKVKINHTFGGSDGRHFAKFGIPILMIKPNGGDIHMDSEWVDLNSCLDFYEAMRDFLSLK